MSKSNMNEWWCNKSDLPSEFDEKWPKPVFLFLQWTKKMGRRCLPRAFVGPREKFRDQLFSSLHRLARAGHRPCYLEYIDDPEHTFVNPYFDLEFVEDAWPEPHASLDRIRELQETRRHQCTKSVMNVVRALKERYHVVV